MKKELTRDCFVNENILLSDKMYRMHIKFNLT